MDKVWLGIATGGGVFLLAWKLTGSMTLGAAFAVGMFVLSLAGIWHSEWSRG